ncbi:MAG: hypothetical protein FWF06_06475 [Symbiobacteriaceae bacterium]|nr:hypothetical protein [Symbiobacteriaceae bacterium]
MRRTLPVALTFIVGVTAMINTYFVNPSLAAFCTRYLARTSTVSSAWAVGLGTLNLMRIHIRRINRRQDNWQYSVSLVVTYVIFLFLGVFLVGHQNNHFFQAFFNSIQPHLSSTMFSVLCFYIASAAFRAFRMRSMEATMMLLSAFIIMLGNVPIGAAIFPPMPQISDWIMNQINTSSLRAMSIGLSMGGIAQTMRNLVGIERGHLAAE